MVVQVKSGSIFDNVLVTDDEKYALKFAEETWGKSKDLEKAAFEKIEEEEKKKQEVREERIWSQRSIFRTVRELCSGFTDVWKVFRREPGD